MWCYHLSPKVIGIRFSRLLNTQKILLQFLKRPATLYPMAAMFNQQALATSGQPNKIPSRHSPFYFHLENIFSWGKTENISSLPSEDIFLFSHFLISCQFFSLLFFDKTIKKGKLNLYHWLSQWPKPPNSRQKSENETAL